MSPSAVQCPKSPSVLTAFPSSLGWMAIIGAGDVLQQLTVAQRSARAAEKALDPALLCAAIRGSWNEGLILRLQAYASGSVVDFRDIKVDLSGLSPFRRRVAEHCRRIPYGQILTYGQLAAKAGSSGAARAVGNCMAANRIPLIIPCHRVVLAGGRIGAFSAPGGSNTKRRLLAIEAAAK